MSDPILRHELTTHGLVDADLEWLDSFGWNPAAVPAPKASQVEAYRRRETALNATIDGVTFAERGASLASKLAAAIGARIADFSDDQDDQDED